MAGKLPVIAAGALALGLGGGFAVAKIVTPPPKPAAEEFVPSPIPVYFEMEPFTLNLAGDDNHVAMLSLALRVANQKFADKLKDQKSVLRHELMLLLTSKTIEDIDEPQDKAALAGEIKQLVNNIMEVRKDIYGVDEAMFTQFVIQ